eukprot:gene1707-476_t
MNATQYLDFDESTEINTSNENQIVAYLNFHFPGAQETLNCFPLYNKKSIKIGRENCDINLNFESISKTHASIEVDEFCFIEDLKSLNKTRLSMNINSKSKILKPEKSFQLNHQNIIFFGKIKCVFLEYEKLSQDDIHKLPLETEIEPDFDDATQFFEKDTLEENSNFESESTQTYHELETTTEQNTQLYEDSIEKKNSPQNESTQVYEENKSIESKTETPSKDIPLFLEETPTSKNDSDSDNTQTSDQENDKSGGIFKNLNFENTIDTTLNSTLNSTFHIDGIDDEDDDDVDLSENTEVKIISNEEHPVPLNFKFNESFSQEQKSSDVTPTLRLESDSNISPTLRIEHNEEKYPSPTLIIERDKKKVDESPNFNEELAEWKKLQNSNVSEDLSDSYPSRAVSPTLKLDDEILKEKDDDETSSDLSDHQNSPIFENKVTDNKNKEMNLRLEDSDTEDDLVNDKKNDEIPIDLSPIFEDSAKKETEKKLIEKVDHFNSDTDIELTPKLSFNDNPKETKEEDVDLTPPLSIDVDELNKENTNEKNVIEDLDLTPPLSVDLNDKKIQTNEDDATPILSVDFNEKKYPENAAFEPKLSIDLNQKVENKNEEQDDDLTPKITIDKVNETVSLTLSIEIEKIMETDDEDEIDKGGVISQEYKKSLSIEATNTNENESISVSDPEFPSQEIIVKKPTIINETIGSDTQDELSQKIEKKTKKRKRVPKGKEVVEETEEDKNKKIKLSPKVMFTGLADEKELKKYSKMVVKLGGTISEDLNEITHLITDKVHRTKKFLCALNNCSIVSLKWLNDSNRKKEFLDEEKYILRDIKAEKQFNFDMLESLKKRKILENEKLKVFSNLNFYVSPNLPGPPQQDMMEIITSAGGNILNTIPTNSDVECLIISFEKEKKSVSKKYKNRKVYGNEFVFSSIMQQEVNFEKNELKL